jgi:hypothetical protein
MPEVSLDLDFTLVNSKCFKNDYFTHPLKTNILNYPFLIDGRNQLFTSVSW